MIQARTKKLIDAAYVALQEENPMTLRQIYYQLVRKHIIGNNTGQYKRLSNALRKARHMGLIPWEWMEDRGRQPRAVGMWVDLIDFLDTVRDSYRKDIWENQPRYFEIWLEKDALSGIFSEITDEYGITLMVGRGYSSWSALKDAADRFRQVDKPVSIMYFGDFDPSGEDIARVLEDSLNELGSYPRVKKVALTYEDIQAHQLPPALAKKTDTRAKAFIEKYGDISVELDALPLKVLKARIRESIAQNLDLSELRRTREQERLELIQLKSKIG